VGYEPPAADLGDGRGPTAVDRPAHAESDRPTHVDRPAHAWRQPTTVDFSISPALTAERGLISFYPRGDCRQ